LLTIQAARGHFGDFYATWEEYETSSRKLSGDNWLNLDGQAIAETFFHLQDYHKAEALLTLHTAKDYVDALREPLAWPYVREDEVPVHDEDLLLEARIQLELGQQEEALRTLAALDASMALVGQKRAVVDNKVLASKKRNLLPLAEIYAALGQPKVALARNALLLSAANPLEEADLWAKAMIQAGQLRLALGEPAGEIVTKLEEMVPHVTEYRELQAVRAVDMDIFLADYYIAQKSLPTAVERLKRGLAFAQRLEVGAVDQQIIILRKLGELAAQSRDLPGARDHYRASIDLLKTISQSIPSDLGKVGYRVERNKAIPLLVATLYELYLQSNDSKDLNEMFGVIEEGKSRALAELLLTADNGQASDLQSIQTALPADAILVEYYTLEGVSAKILRLVIDQTSRPVVDVLTLGSDQLTTRIQTLLEEVKEVTPPQDFNELAFKKHAAEMGEVLLPPSWFSDYASIPAKRVFIVPTGILHLLPFSLLVDKHGHYLDENEQMEVAYLPNASMLNRLPPRFVDASRSAGFVNPALDEDHRQTLAGSGDLRARLSAAFRQWSGGEVAWEEPLTAHEFLSQAVTIDNMFLYSHGRFIPDDPTGSYVRFLKNVGDDHPYVSAAQLLATRGKGRIGRGLWVLAACSSGVGKVRSGDEVLGLPRALLEAGANMVVISLWDLDAPSSLDFTARFYENLASDLPVARALHSASAMVRRAGNLPYDWAPFILIGHHGFNDDKR
jgi:CHAT domain-containing protein